MNYSVSIIMLAAVFLWKPDFKILHHMGVAHIRIHCENAGETGNSLLKTFDDFTQLLPLGQCLCSVSNVRNTEDRIIVRLHA